MTDGGVVETVVDPFGEKRWVFRVAKKNMGQIKETKKHNMYIYIPIIETIKCIWWHEMMIEF